ncbi:MAG: anti-sigma factor family protein [bacterium]
MTRKCVGEEILIDYLEDRLSDKERAEVEEHLSNCDKCMDVLIMGKRMVDDERLPDAEQTPLEPVPDHVTRQAIEKLKALDNRSIFERFFQIFTSDIPQCAFKFSEWFSDLFDKPAFAPVRGNQSIMAKDYITVKKSFKNLDIEIEFEKRGPDRSMIRIMSLEKNLSIQPVRVTLMRDGLELSSHLISKEGALFEDIPFGSYVFIFTQGGKKMGEYPFRIKETKRKLKK